MKEKLSVCEETAVSYEQEHICTGLVLVGFSVYKHGTCILWLHDWADRDDENSDRIVSLVRTT